MTSGDFFDRLAACAWTPPAVHQHVVGKKLLSPRKFPPGRVDRHALRLSRFSQSNPQPRLKPQGRIPPSGSSSTMLFAAAAHGKKPYLVRLGPSRAKLFLRGRLVTYSMGRMTPPSRKTCTGISSSFPRPPDVTLAFPDISDAPNSRLQSGLVYSGRDLRVSAGSKIMHRPESSLQGNGWGAGIPSIEMSAPGGSRPSLAEPRS